MALTVWSDHPTSALLFVECSLNETPDGEQGCWLVQQEGEVPDDEAAVQEVVSRRVRLKVPEVNVK